MTKIGKIKQHVKSLNKLINKHEYLCSIVGRYREAILLMQRYDKEFIVKDVVFSTPDANTQHIYIDPKSTISTQYFKTAFEVTVEKLEEEIKQIEREIEHKAEELNDETANTPSDKQALLTTAVVPV